MTSDRKNPTAGFWITVVVVAAMVGYPLSFGPAIWIGNHGWLPDQSALAVYTIYSPLYYFADECRPASEPYRWYLRHFTD